MEQDTIDILIPSRRLAIGNASKTRNRLAQNSKADILVFFDDDVIFTNDTIHQLTNDMKGDAVSGRYGESPHKNFITQLQNIILMFRFKDSRYVSFINSACFAIKRKVFERAGGFNESMNYYEDMELGHRVKNCYINSNAIVIHNKKFTHISLLQDYYRKAKVAGLYFRKNPTCEKNLPAPIKLILCIYKKKGLWFTFLSMFILFEIAIVTIAGLNES